MRCIHAWFEEQVERTPDNIAVSSGRTTLTYRELNERANQLAHFLRKRGVGPMVFVGICVDRNPMLIVGLLGILKAGGTYVPIDPHYPRERIAFILQDAKSPLILSEAAFAPQLEPAHTAMVFLDRDWPLIAECPRDNPVPNVTPENLAYVIYTSGSTGAPKGTLISHHNVTRLFAATRPWFDFTQHDVWTLFHSAAFDFSVWEIWGALLYGGKLIVVPFGISRTPEAFYRLLSEEGVTVLNQTPSAFRQLIRAQESIEPALPLALRYVIFGGEALDLAMLKPWFARHGDTRPQLINMYGITETTVHVTYRPLTAADVNSRSVIGVPIGDLNIYLLDGAQRPVADGEPGEIYVGGDGVALGYLNRPELTAQRFIPNPLAPRSGQRVYRSGDLARRLPNGDLEYLGRIDSQVKVRGFRIELGEITAALNQHAAVRESVVIAHEEGGEKALAAYVVKQPGASVDTAGLRASLRAQLPEYMVPTYLQFVDHVPLTVNGKLDVKALPPPTAPLAPTADEPATLESQIAGIWREVLKTGAIGLDQNFFDVGGNSIHIADAHSRLQQLLGRQFSITELFAHSTVRALAAHFNSAVGVRNDGRTAADRGNAADRGKAADGRDGGDLRDAGANRVRAERQREALAARRNLQRADRR
jgi:amino acid adenylation domain-containing protein